MVLIAQQNDVLTQVGPGTPCGELMRRYWMPAALSEEIPKGGAPIPVRLLGEDLVLFRDDTGRPGLLGLHCAHRGADLSYGRVEDGGLRCIYHGWLYDVGGRCLEQPGEPAGSTFHERIRQVAYPCQEAGGIVFAYMGTGEPPLLPAYEALTQPEQHRQADKFWLDCSYLQGLEGSIDPTHLSFLHTNLGGGGSPSNRYFLQDRAPTIEVEETDFGLRIMAARDADPGQTYLRVSNFMLPVLASIPTGPMRQEGYTINFHVPIDDTHHWNYMLEFNRKHPMNDRIMDTREIADGYRIVQNRENRYLQDRSWMKQSFSGMGRSFSAQDACVTEGPGPIQNRTEEHPGYSDRAILAARAVLMRALQDAQAGRDPIHVLRDEDGNRFPHLVVVNDVVPSPDWRDRWKDAMTAASVPA
jgi:phenylpropionate dioxygenase-like ring-hydroxylating dioxygenase large terminal subunit